MRKLVAIGNPWMAILFAIAAALQWNDPDPWAWIPMYGAATVACILRTLGKLRPWFSAVVGAAALVWAITYVPRLLEHGRFGDMFESMKASNPAIEETREFGGLAIVVLWMTALTLAARKRA